MNIKDSTGWLGQWELVVADTHGNILERTGLVPNLLMDVGLNMIRDALNGTVTDLEIKFVALGSSNTAPANGQTQLAAEQFRKPVTAQNVLAGVGALETLLYIPEFEANDFMTQEIGWFSGTNASSTTNTGLMIARVLYSRQKNSGEQWTLRRVDTIRRG